MNYVTGRFKDMCPKFLKQFDNPLQAVSACAGEILVATHGQREYIIDSGASNHLVAMNQLHEAEKGTIRSLPSDRQIQCAN